MRAEYARMRNDVDRGRGRVLVSLRNDHQVQGGRTPRERGAPLCSARAMVAESTPLGDNLRLPCGFGRYVLLQRLGAGGMGEVFLARQELAGVDRFCVIKSLRAHLGDNREYV